MISDDDDLPDWFFGGIDDNATNAFLTKSEAITTPYVGEVLSSDALKLKVLFNSKEYYFKQSETPFESYSEGSKVIIWIVDDKPQLIDPKWNDIYQACNLYYGSILTDLIIINVSPQGIYSEYDDWSIFVPTEYLPYDKTFYGRFPNANLLGQKINVTILKIEADKIICSGYTRRFRFIDRQTIKSIIASNERNYDPLSIQIWINRLVWHLKYYMDFEIKIPPIATMGEQNSILNRLRNININISNLDTGVYIDLVQRQIQYTWIFDEEQWSEIESRYPTGAEITVSGAAKCRLGLIFDIVGETLIKGIVKYHTYNRSILSDYVVTRDMPTLKATVLKIDKEMRVLELCGSMISDYYNEIMPTLIETWIPIKISKYEQYIYIECFFGQIYKITEIYFYSLFKQNYTFTSSYSYIWAYLNNKDLKRMPFSSFVFSLKSTDIHQKYKTSFENKYLNACTNRYYQHEKNAVFIRRIIFSIGKEYVELRTKRESNETQSFASKFTDNPDTIPEDRGLINKLINQNEIYSEEIYSEEIYSDTNNRSFFLKNTYFKFNSLNDMRRLSSIIENDEIIRTEVIFERWKSKKKNKIGIFLRYENLIILLPPYRFHPNNRKELFVKIKYFNARMGKVVARLPEHKEEREEQNKCVFNFKVGDVVKGKVHKLVKYGVFFKIWREIVPSHLRILPNALLHISEVSWNYRRAYSEEILETFEIGKEYDLLIIKLEEKKQKTRISLSLKALFSPPWLEVNIGDEIHGVITNKVDYGVFVKVINSYEGLLHHSKFLEGDTLDTFSVGQKITVYIENISEDGKVSLRRVASVDA